MAATEAPAPGLMTVREAALHLRIGERTLWRWLAEKKLPCIRLSRKVVRIRPADLDAAVEAHRVS